MEQGGLNLIKPFSLENEVEFGVYKWKILVKENGKVLLITTDCIEQRGYHDEWVNITWEKCTLRKYLNNEFYSQFSDEEKAQILKTKVINKNNEKSTSVENDTEDYVFLLSIDEVNKYFEADEDRIAKYGDKAVLWWLRSPNCGVDSRGYVGSSACSVNYSRGVRPALWINYESLNITKYY